MNKHKLQIGKTYRQKSTGIEMKVLKYAGVLFNSHFYIFENVETKFKCVLEENLFEKKTN